MRYLVMIIGIFFGDNFIKNYIEKQKTFGSEEEILKGKVTIVKHHNKGAMLNFMQDKPEWIARISCACFGGLAVFFAGLFSKKENAVLKTGASILAGGALSNLYDRLKKGYVVDYFIVNVGKLKKIIFNLSDIMIFLGGLITVIGSLFCDENK